MTLLNPALALGAAALLVPLVIHLLHRNRVAVVEWGASFLLEDVVRSNRRRFRLHEWLLLAVRCAIPVLLALCLARPVLTGAGGLKGDAPGSLVVVLDDSYSMSAPGDGDGSRFDEARDATAAFIDAAGRGSDFAVIRTGSRAAGLLDAPVFDPAAVTGELAAADAAFGPTAAAASLDAALSTLAGMSHADRELVILSDFQPADWDPLTGDAAAAVRRRIEDAEVPPTVTLVPIPAGEMGAGNLSVESVERPSRPVGIGQPARIRAVLRNAGAADRAARVTLAADGAEIAVKTVDLPAAGTARVTFAPAFAEPGSHPLGVTVAPAGGPPDPLPADDSFRSVLTVPDRLPALLVDGAPSAAPLGGETAYLALALAPLTFAGGDASDLLATRTVTSDGVTGEALNDARLVVLANVPRLSDAAADALTAWVKDGGSLLVTAGDLIDGEWWNDRFFADGTGPLPRPWGEPVEPPDPARIAGGRFDHPGLERFNDPAAGDLTGVAVRRWLAVGEGPPENPGRVIASLTGGAPLLIARPFGEGEVVQMTTAIDADWSDLPLRPAFVPLVQGLAAALAERSEPPRNLTAGEPLVAEVPSDVAAVTVRSPDGQRATVAPELLGERSVVRFADTRRPGFYTLSWPGSKPVRFAAEVDRRESDPGTLDAAALARLADRLGATTAASVDDYLAADRTKRHGRELWRWLLAGLLAAMTLEMLLRGRFGGGRG